MWLLDIYMLACFQCSNSVLRVGRVIRRDVQHANVRMIDYDVWVCSMKWDPVPCAERRRTIRIDVHAGANDRAELAGQIITNIRECIITAAKKTDCLTL